MDIKSKLTRVAVAGLTIGALTVAGFATAATAFADGDGMGTPDPSNDGGIQLPPGVILAPPIFASPADPNAIVLPAPVFATPDPYIYPTYPVYPVYPTYSYNYQSTQGIFVTGTAEVLGTTTDAILAEMAQGRSLTTIAGERGWSRDYFLSLLVNRVQSDLIYGINNGTIDPATGNALLSNLINQASVSIDQVGYQSIASYSVYGIYPVSPS